MNGYPKKEIEEISNDYRKSHFRLGDILDALGFLSEIADTSGSDLKLSACGRDGLAVILNMLKNAGWDALTTMPLPDHFDKLVSGNGGKRE